MMEKPKALISVWDKEGISELATALASHGYEILSSSGTASFLRDRGHEVTEVLELTDYPAILGGRVKTLHPRVMGGILARRGQAQDDMDCATHGIPHIDVVVCTLYPFEETAKKGGALDELIEKIDIGGVSLIRAAAKNYYHVTVITDKEDYPRMIETMEKEEDIPLSFRQEMAIKAFKTTAIYDSVIFEGLSESVGAVQEKNVSMRILPLRMAQGLRYGENPHQTAALYLPPLASAPFEQLSGKELSYNNLLDLDSVLRGCSVFQGDCACTIVKHTTPCGTALGSTPAEAFQRAHAGDPVSAFGGILGFTRAIDMSVAKLLTPHFFELIAAPAFLPDALEYLKSAKPNLRLLTITGQYPVLEQITGNRCGFMIQSDALPPLPVEQEGKWIGTPRTDLWNDLLFAWKTAAITKSNAIVIAKDTASLGIGGGFTNRVDACQYALTLAADKAQGAVLASDAFFPFADSIQLAADAGIAAIIQPGGSMRDDEVAQAALDCGISMFIGSGRTFRH